MYYQISYRPGQPGCPDYFDGDLNEAWEWDEYDPGVHELEIKHQYVYRANHEFVDFDYCDEYLVSTHFARLCDQFGMRERLVPVTIVESDGERTKKDYVFLLSSEHISILDVARSEYVVARQLETGEIVRDRYCPDVVHYDSIVKFVVDPDRVAGRHIFRCIDLARRYVCSQPFKDACEQSGMLGLAFTPIDDNFKVAAFW
ncbi:imm11 family protein [Lysobacter cavernae]|uniref:Imm11 family protein n=1 Tax=Lysobacter cavernae TaxID=1685901 RepID=A0ABV7RTR3_9GAMM